MRLALVAALLASAPAHAGPVATAALGRSALPLPPGMLFMPTLSSFATPRFALTPSPVAFRPTLPTVPMLTPTLPNVAMPAAVAQPALIAPAAVTAQTPVRAALTQTAASIAEAKPSQRASVEASATSALFDGFRTRGAVNAVQQPQRTPDWWEDQRINRAIELLNQSPIGRDLYAQIYSNHRDLRIQIDETPGASYDARLVRDGGQKTLYLTKALVNNQSAEVVAAYLAREMSDLYFESFPASAERGYMAYSNMTRVFAELTGSGLARQGYWWNRSKDQRVDGTYAMERYYGSWREAVQQDYSGRTRLRDSAFFNFLKGRDDSNAGGASKLSLREQYDRGLISYSTYREMDQYFSTIVNSEVGWLNGSGRW